MTGVNFDVNALKETPALDTAGKGDGAAGSGAADKDQGTNKQGADGAAGAGGAGDGKGAGDDGKGAAAKPAGDGKDGDGKGAGDDKGTGDGKGADGAGAKPGDDGKGAGDGKGTGDDGKGAAAKPVAPNETELEKMATDKLLKSLGVKDLDELKQKMQANIVETPEQKATREAKYVTDLDNFAITNKYMSREEVIALENIKKATDEDLAYNTFSVEFKAGKADATDEEVKQAFKLFYHTEADDAKLKEQGAKVMKQQADNVRAVLQSKWNSAKESFDDVAVRRSKVAPYKETIQNAVKEYVPAQYELHVDGENKIVFEISPNDHAVYEKLLVGDDTFDAFLKHGKSQPMSDLLKDKIAGLILLKNKDQIFKTLYDAGLNNGRNSGSNTGATNSFALKDGKSEKVVVEDNGNDLSAADKEKLGSLFGAR